MDAIERFGETISLRLAELGILVPDKKTVRALLRVVHAASLITEEGRFVQGSVTFADPDRPDSSPPLRRRAAYPHFTPLETAVELTPEFLVKIARAVDKWSGSIAVWGNSARTLNAWGLVDQLVGTNTYLNREAEGGYSHLGYLTVIIDRPGDLTAYHGIIFLGSLRAQRSVLTEGEAFRSEHLYSRLAPAFAASSVAISGALKKVGIKYRPERALSDLINSWQQTIARLCIGLRRLGTGGSLILTPAPNKQLLKLSYGFEYDRLSSAITLQVLDSTYRDYLELNWRRANSISRKEMADQNFADTDLRKR